MYYDNKGKIYLFSTRLDQLCHYETAFVAFYHSDQPVDYPDYLGDFCNILVTMMVILTILEAILALLAILVIILTILQTILVTILTMLNCTKIVRVHTAIQD